jgi:hypothetical protein
MNPDPLHRVACFPAVADRLKFRVFLLDLFVAGHARLRRRDVGMRGNVDKAVAVAAIHSELVHMQCMRKGHRLDGGVSDARIFGRRVIPGRAGKRGHKDHDNDEKLKGQPIGPTREKIRHNSLSASRSGSPAAAYP